MKKLIIAKGTTTCWSSVKFGFGRVLGEACSLDEYNLAKWKPNSSLVENQGRMGNQRVWS